MHRSRYGGPSWRTGLEHRQCRSPASGWAGMAGWVFPSDVRKKRDRGVGIVFAWHRRTSGSIHSAGTTHEAVGDNNALPKLVENSRLDEGTTSIRDAILRAIATILRRATDTVSARGAESSPRKRERAPRRRANRSACIAHRSREKVRVNRAEALATVLKWLPCIIDCPQRNTRRSVGWWEETRHARLWRCAYVAAPIHGRRGGTATCQKQCGQGHRYCDLLTHDLAVRLRTIILLCPPRPPIKLRVSTVSRQSVAVGVITGVCLERPRRVDVCSP
jgi:hypothetical protein